MHQQSEEACLRVEGFLGSQETCDEGLRGHSQGVCQQRGGQPQLQADLVPGSMGHVYAACSGCGYCKGASYGCRAQRQDACMTTSSQTGQHEAWQWRSPGVT